MATMLLPNSLFVHIPKTGGTWTSHVLKDMGIVQTRFDRAHERPSEYRELIGNRLYFTFIRNPITWYQSRWAGPYARSVYPQRTRNQAGFHFANKRELHDFRYWLTNALDRNSASNFFHEYIDDCDFIGKTENLKNDLTSALKIAGEKFNKKFLNSPPINKAKEELDRSYSKLLIRRVIQRDKDFMKKFNYPIEWQYYAHLIV